MGRNEDAVVVTLGTPVPGGSIACSQIAAALHLDLWSRTTSSDEIRDLVDRRWGEYGLR